MVKITDVSVLLKEKLQDGISTLTVRCADRVIFENFPRWVTHHGFEFWKDGYNSQYHVSYYTRTTPGMVKMTDWNERSMEAMIRARHRSEEAAHYERLDKNVPHNIFSKLAVTLRKEEQCDRIAASLYSDLAIAIWKSHDYETRTSQK